MLIYANFTNVEEKFTTLLSWTNGLRFCFCFYDTLVVKSAWRGKLHLKKKKILRGAANFVYEKSLFYGYCGLRLHVGCKLLLFDVCCAASCRF